MNIHEKKGLTDSPSCVTIAENLQNMKPVQNCKSLIFFTFHEVAYIFKKAKGSGNGFQDHSFKFYI